MKITRRVISNGNNSFFLKYCISYKRYVTKNKTTEIYLNNDPRSIPAGVLQREVPEQVGKVKLK